MVYAMSGCVVTSALMLLIKMAAVHSGTVDTVRGAETFNTDRGIGRYLYHAGPSNWRDAHKVCRLEGGHLVIVDSNEEADILSEIIAPYRPVGQVTFSVHIGIHDLYQEGDYVTVKGQSLNESGYQIRTTAVTGGTDQNCGSFYYGDTFVTEGLLLDSPCEKSQPFVCEYGMWYDYELIPGFGYYKLSRERVLWAEAESTCRSEGSYLLILNSDAEREAVENRFISGFYMEAPLVWYGAHQKFANLMFVTIFDELLEETGFSTWSDNFPPEGYYGYTNLALYIKPNSSLESRPDPVYYKFICKHNLHGNM